MRELSFDEIELVSGGSILDTVTAVSTLNTLSQASLRSIANSAISAAGRNVRFRCYAKAVVF